MQLHKMREGRGPPTLYPLTQTRAVIMILAVREFHASLPEIVFGRKKASSIPG